MAPRLTVDIPLLPFWGFVGQRVQRQTRLSTSPRCRLASAGMFTAGGSAHCGRHIVAATLERRSAALQRISVFFLFFFPAVTQNVNAAQSGPSEISQPRGVLKYCSSCGKSARAKIMLTARVQSLELFNGPVSKVWLNL